jgi:hypothetical protein
MNGLFKILLKLSLTTALLIGLAVSCNPGLMDSDGDGLPDKVEKDGWLIRIEDGFKQSFEYYNNSNPRKPDTDGDGLSDYYEYIVLSDARSMDTDGDGLTDSEEGLYGSNLLDADSDDDALPYGQTTPVPDLFDYGEVKLFTTSPALADTDGDGRGDLDEITGGGHNPLIAETPQLKIEIVGEPSISMNYVETTGSQEKQSLKVSSITQEETSLSNSHSQTNSQITDISGSIGADFSGDFKSIKVGASLEIGGGGQWVDETTSKSSVSTSQSFEQGYNKFNEYTENQDYEVTGGNLTIAYKVHNTGQIGVHVKDLQLSILRFDKGSIIPVATMSAVSNIPIPAEGQTGTLSVTGELDVQTTRELLRNPGSITTEVAYFSMEWRYENDAELLNYTNVSTSLRERTTQLVIDYGNGDVEKYSIRTSFKRDANGHQTGITLGEALDILSNDPDINLQYETMYQDVYDDETGAVIGKAKVIDRIRDVSTLNLENGYWMSLTTSESLDTHEVIDIDDIVLHRGGFTSLAIVKDADLDGLIDREEHIIGTDLLSPDSDSDGLDDIEEVRESWMVSVIGSQPYQVRSSPISADFDSDGLNDAQEKAGETDPYKEDTDSDGVNDMNDFKPWDPDIQ